MSYNQGFRSQYGQRDMRQEMNNEPPRHNNRTRQVQRLTVLEMLEAIMADVEEIKYKINQLTPHNQYNNVPQLPSVQAFHNQNYSVPQNSSNVPVTNDLLRFPATNNNATMM